VRGVAVGARVALAGALLLAGSALSCAGGSVEGAVPSYGAACEHLDALHEILAEYDQIVAAGGTKLNAPTFDLEHLRDLTIRLKALASELAADADRAEAADALTTSSLRELAETVRQQGENLGLLRGVDSPTLTTRESRMARELGCPPPPSSS
jgi:hypothetical protein